MYGIIGSASGHIVPARGWMHRVIMLAEHPGQSTCVVSGVNQVGPVAHRPVVADGRHRRHAGSRRCGDRRECRHHVLRVHDVKAFAAQALSEKVPETCVEPLTLEVVASVRDVGRAKAEFGDGETIVRGFGDVLRRAPVPAGQSQPRDPASAVRPRARECSSRFRRTRAETSRSGSGPSRAGFPPANVFVAACKLRYPFQNPLAVRLPAVVTLGARPRRRAEPRAQRRVSQPLECLRECLRVGWIVEQSLALVTDERRDAIRGRRHHRESRRHVLENLQRRPVEPELERTMGGEVERSGADVGGGEAGRHASVRHRSGEDDPRDALRLATSGGQFRAVASEHRADVVPAPRAQRAGSRGRGAPRRASCGTRRRRSPRFPRGG